MSAPAINALPEPPVRSNAPADFSAKADAFLAALPPMVVQINASLLWVQSTADDVSGWASAAAGSADAAALSAGQANTQRIAAEDAAAASAGFRDASQAAAGESAGSATAAAGHANAADLARQGAATERAGADAARADAVQAKDDAEYWAGQAQETVTAGIINDDSLLPTRVRSAQDASRGHFRAVPAAADVAIEALDFAQVSAAGTAVTVTLPADPEPGQLVMVGNLTDRLDHRVTVAKVNGRATDGHLTLNKPFAIVTLKFVSADYGWSIL